MGIDRHQISLGILYHDDIGRFLSHTGKFHQLFLLQGDLSVIVLYYALCHFDEVFGFVVEKRAGFDVAFDFIQISIGKRDGIGVFFKQCRGNDVDPFVRTLCRKHHRYQKFVKVVVFQLRDRIGIVFQKECFDRFDLFFCRFFDFCHASIPFSNLSKTKIVPYKRLINK